MSSKKSSESSLGKLPGNSCGPTVDNAKIRPKYARQDLGSLAPNYSLSVVVETNKTLLNEILASVKLPKSSKLPVKSDGGLSLAQVNGILGHLDYQPAPLSVIPCKDDWGNDTVVAVILTWDLQYALGSGPSHESATVAARLLDLCHFIAVARHHGKHRMESAKVARRLVLKYPELLSPRKEQSTAPADSALAATAPVGTNTTASHHATPDGPVVDLNVVQQFLSDDEGKSVQLSVDLATANARLNVDQDRFDQAAYRRERTAVVQENMSNLRQRLAQLKRASAATVHETVSVDRRIAAMKTGAHRSLTHKRTALIALADDSTSIHSSYGLREPEKRFRSYHV